MEDNPWSALYFIALMTIGNYVLFNLLVAILVEGFQNEVITWMLYVYVFHVCVSYECCLYV